MVDQGLMTASSGAHQRSASLGGGCSREAGRKVNSLRAAMKTSGSHGVLLSGFSRCCASGESREFFFGGVGSLREEEAVLRVDSESAVTLPFEALRPVPSPELEWHGSSSFKQSNVCDA